MTQNTHTRDIIDTGQDAAQARIIAAVDDALKSGGPAQIDVKDLDVFWGGRLMAPQHLDELAQRIRSTLHVLEDLNVGALRALMRADRVNRYPQDAQLRDRDMPEVVDLLSTAAAVLEEERELLADDARPLLRGRPSNRRRPVGAFLTS